MGEKTSRRGEIGLGWQSGGTVGLDPAGTGWQTRGTHLGIEGTNLKAQFWAAYHEASDLIEIEFTILDADGDPFTLSEVVGVSFYLHKGPNVLQSAVGLTKFYGNEDFSFRCLFMHPAATRGLEIRVVAEVRETTIDLRRSVILAPVTPAESDLADNAATLLEDV